ncbi:DUF3558 domain-containing protein [Nocardia sp. NPDC048505]|uniref:DUF3558 domain-containing protein n=1 Tax=unclassified Nocardia TaxID=2637762 RepID=UPI003410BF2A
MAALAGVVLLVSGCQTKTDGKPEPSTGATSGAAAALWDPCTQVTDAVLKQIGVEPSTKKSGVAGVEEPGWKVCNWNNSDFNLSVFSTARTVDEFKQKPDNADFKDVTVGGRGGVQYHRKSDTENEICDLVFPAKQGSISVMVSNRVSSDNKVAPCVRADAAAAQLVPLWPS